jgi:hypothetical protein
MSKLYGWHVPLLDGHAFFAGYQYKGPHAHMLNQFSLANIPVPDAVSIAHRFAVVCTDLFKMIGTATPAYTIPAAVLTACSLDTDEYVRVGGIPLRVVLTLKWLLSPLVCTPIDRNLKMAMFCCPHLYNNCALRLYDPEAVPQYMRVYALSYQPMKLAAAWVDAGSIATLPITSAEPTRVALHNYHGHLNRSIAWVYHQLGLAKLARLDVGGGEYGYAYMYFKWKHVSVMNPAKVRGGRPLWPMSKTIDHWFMSRMGKLGAGLVKLLPDECMLLNATSDLVPCLSRHLAACDVEFGAGEYVVRKCMWDVSGMYTQMGHVKVMRAVDWMIATVLQRHRTEVFHVRVNRNKQVEAGIGMRRDHNFMNVTSRQFTYACLIALHFSFGWFGSSCLLLQVFGCPMGNPMSPFFCKALTAYASFEFCASVYNELAIYRTRMFGVCFIDDIELFLVCRRCDFVALQTWMTKLFMRFETGAFPDPLVLERDDGDVYLETLLKVVESDIYVSHNTKIDLKALLLDGKTLLRLHSFRSFCPREMLFGTLVGTLCRCVANSSHDHLLADPVLMVLKEFEMLGYPVSMCEAAVRLVAVKRSSAAIADVLIVD